LSLLLRRPLIAAVTGAVLVLAVVAGIAWAKSNEPPTATFTGCLNLDTGRMSAVALGEKPAVPCRNGLQTVSWEGDAVVGVNGKNGKKGATGQMGPPGPQGATGPAGTPGTPGAQGAPGPQGVAGRAGKDGASGASGKAGARGAPGARGVRGRQGVGGPAGKDGAAGAVGPAGPPGTGPPGPQGETGPPGPIGPLGPLGPIGPTGPQGPPGPAGPAATFYRVTSNQAARPDTPAGGVQAFCDAQSYNLNFVNATGSPLIVWDDDSAGGVSVRTITPPPGGTIITIFFSNATGPRHVTLRSTNGTNTTQFDMYFTTGTGSCLISIAQQTAANTAAP
jgi:Collagen triple helix repeat (20 copies)